mgnify:CR=1 FL=1
MTETIGVVSHTERVDVARPASPSWFIAKINPVSRFIGALILCIPMLSLIHTDAADDLLCVDLGGRRIIKKKKKKQQTTKRGTNKHKYIVR